MKRLFDLRFVIGIFFLVVGILLLGYGLLNNTPDSPGVNTWCGSIFAIFGALMILLAVRKNAD